MTGVLTAAWILSCWPSEADLSKAIERLSWAPKSQRADRARTLAKRILVEAGRWRLDPVALAAVGSVESDYRPALKGPGFKPRGFGYRIHEYGTFQLIPRSTVTLAASRELARCADRTKICPARDVYQARMGKTGPLTGAELEGYVVGTWVAAREIRMHVDGCKLRHPHGHQKWWTAYRAKKLRLSVREVRRLARWGHYNTGASYPLRRYLKRLTERYTKLKRLACAREK